MSLQEALRGRRVVVLPDLFLDALVPLPPWEQAAASMAAIAARGGGNLPVGPIAFRPGGNAANLALSLGRLGIPVQLVAQTDAMGLAAMRRAAQDLSVDLRHVEVAADASATVALECPDANVMLSHAGPVADFGPEGVSEAAWRAIAQADAVAVVNWSQNRRGTELLREVAHRAPGPLLYLDTGDPRHRPDAARLLEADVWSSIDAWGLNENELLAFSGRGHGTLDEDGLVGAAQELARRLGTRLDLHTRTFAASTDGADMTRVPADDAPAKRLTGAGDAWNAGNLAGYLAGMEPADRLALAHATATRHVTGQLLA